MEGEPYVVGPCLLVPSSPIMERTMNPTRCGVLAHV